MINIHTRHCKYRKYQLLPALKKGKISGKFYKFLCRNFPYNLNYHGIRHHVCEVVHGREKEDVAILILKTSQKHKEQMKHQREMVKANKECRKKIGSEV